MNQKRKGVMCLYGGTVVHSLFFGKHLHLLIAASVKVLSHPSHGYLHVIEYGTASILNGEMCHNTFFSLVLTTTQIINTK